VSQSRLRLLHYTSHDPLVCTPELTPSSTSRSASCFICFTCFPPHYVWFIHVFSSLCPIHSLSVVVYVTMCFESFPVPVCCLEFKSTIELELVPLQSSSSVCTPLHTRDIKPFYNFSKKKGNILLTSHHALETVQMMSILNWHYFIGCLFIYLKNNVMFALYKKKLQ